MVRLLPFLPILSALLLAPALVAGETQQGERAYIRLKVPADSKVDVGGQTTTQTGEIRTFASPPLPKIDGKVYTYPLRAIFKNADGKDVTVERKVEVAPGKTTEVDLTPVNMLAARSDNSSRYATRYYYGGAGGYFGLDFNLPGYSLPESQPKLSYGSSYSGRYYDTSYRPPVGEHWVTGYTRSDGPYVRGHYQTNPDDSFWNNYSSKGNVNPHTGKVGTRLPPANGGR